MVSDKLDGLRQEIENLTAAIHYFEDQAQVWRERRDSRQAELDVLSLLSP